MVYTLDLFSVLLLARNKFIKHVWSWKGGKRLYGKNGAKQHQNILLLSAVSLMRG
jgi:hypothetical protein